MPIRNVSLTDSLHEDQEYEAKMIALRAAIKEGEDSGIYPGDALQSVWDELGFPPRA